VKVGADARSSGYAEQVGRLDGVGELVRRLGPGEDAAALASALELVLEGLHLNKMLNRDPADCGYCYRA